jgi:hypothetical protein
MNTQIFCLVIILLLISAAPVLADGLFVEAGPGFYYSGDTTVMLVRYQKSASALFGHDSFYEATYASWNGPNHADAFSLARGLQWEFEDNVYVSADMGLGHISRTTGNLGTPFVLAFRFASGKRVGSADFSLGLIHYSNGKFVFGWTGPNNSENFLTCSFGMTF